MILPFLDTPFPQDGAVERIPADQVVFGGQFDGFQRAFIDDVEYAASGRNQRAHAGCRVMMPAPHRGADPLVMFDRADGRIFRNRVVAGIV